VGKEKTVDEDGEEAPNPQIESNSGLAWFRLADGSTGGLSKTDVGALCWAGS
jgi:hypothetical protein